MERPRVTLEPLKVRKRLYKDFLHPALHRRVASALAVSIGVSYLEAVVLARWDSVLWALSPLGWTGLRAVLLFVCGFCVVFYRIAHYHVGMRTTTSAIQSVLQSLFTLSTVWCIVAYVTSAVIFGQIYLATLDGAGLDWLIYFSESRARVNEKPLFLTAHFVILGVVQAVLHIATDADRILLGYVEALPSDGHKNERPTAFQRFCKHLPGVLITSLNRSSASIAVSLVVYPLFLRGVLWRTTVGLLRPFYSLPKTNMLPIAWPYTLGTLCRCLFGSFLVLLLWTVINLSSSIFLAREPVKNHKPLTSDCKEPNRSLLNGLKSRKPHVQCFAMWELALIARDFEPRRRAIYEDTDAIDGPMWSQIYAACRDVITSMNAQIDELTKPPVEPAPVVAVEKKRTTAPPKEGDILVATPKKDGVRGEFEKSVEQFAQAPGHGSPLGPMAKAATAAARRKLVQLQRDATGVTDPREFWRQTVVQVLATRVGAPFRLSWERRVLATVLGSPQGEPTLCSNAAFALSTLAMRSLTEDRYGHVQHDVANMVRMFTESIRKLDALVTDFAPHWTDVDADRRAPDVDKVLAALRTGLALLIEGFGQYANDLKLSRKEMREAREAAGGLAGLGGGLG